MKRCLYYILFSFSLTPLISDAIGSGMWGTTPVQVFQEMDSQTPSPTTLSQPKSSKKALSEKDVLSSKASKKASQDASLNNPVVKEVVPSAAQTPLPNSDDISASASASLERVYASTWQAELAQLNENSLQFQQQTDEQLVNLSNNVQLLQQQLQNLEKAIMLLNQEPIQLKQAIRSELSISQPQGSRLSIAAWMSSLKTKLEPSRFQILIGGMVIIFLLLTWICWLNQKKQRHNRGMKNSNPPIGDIGDTEDEYDYMDSSESTPTKINLARTYIAMENYKAARRVLNEVIQNGNENQKKAADELLEELPIKT